MSQELRDRVARYSDGELVNALRDPDSFTPSSVQIMEEEAEARGGKDALFARVEAARRRAAELSALVPEIKRLFEANDSQDTILQGLASSGFHGEDVVALVQAVGDAHEEHTQQMTDTPRSMVMAVVGGVVASVVGAAYLSFLIIGRERVFVIFALGFIGLNFGLVRWFSGGKQTTVVGSVTAVSIVAAVLLGYWMHSHHILSGE